MRAAGRLGLSLAPPVMVAIALTVFASTSSAEQGVVKFAIFPSHSIVPCFEDIDWMYVGPIRKHLAETANAELSYSYYDAEAHKTIIAPLHELWTSNVARRKPALDAVRAAARRIEVDAVIMAWVRCSQYSTHPPHLYRVEVYAVDVDQERVCRGAALSSWSGRAAVQAIDVLLAARATASEDELISNDWAGPECRRGFARRAD